ncbi:MAG: aryl-sulfate sulfotransferase [Ignavibacteriae bacterium]|nr:aryl-sulfate sulfotransferase [Ignavibacteriota bacterium]
MRTFFFKLYILIIFLILNQSFTAFSQTDINVVTLDNPSPGYIFLQSYFLDYLGYVDNSGQIVYRKKLNKSQTSITLELQPNGKVSYFSGNKFYITDYNFVITDSFEVKNGCDTDFHDFKLTPDGHAFLIGIKHDTVDMSAIIPGGKPNAILNSSVIQEQDESKNVVWEWKSSEHFQISDVTSDIDLTWDVIPWTHTNWIELDYDGNIVISNRNMDEITKINKVTGDIIWRLGGKASKNNQFNFLNDTVNNFWGFSHQHSVHRLSNGNLLMFDNGNQKPIQHSRAVEYELDEVNKTITRVWEYHSFPETYTMFQGSVQRLPNGNTMIGWGTNNQQMTLTEVFPDGSRAMEVRDFDAYLAMRYPVKMDSKLLMIQNIGIYSFSDSANKTAISLNIKSKTGNGFVSVERHYYEPHNIQFSDVTPISWYPNRWVINNKGISNLSAKISFLISEIDSLESPDKYNIFWRQHEGSGSFIKLPSNYNQSSGTIEAEITSFGEFIIAEPPLYEIPVPVSPNNGSKKNPLSINIVWGKINGSDSYKLQISENSNFSSNLIDTNIIDTLFSFDGFDNNKLYYWRLQSVYGNNTSEWTSTWNFTTILASPVLVKPLNNSIDFNLQGDFEWHSTSGASYYKINISKTSEFDSIIVDETGITDTNYRTSIMDYANNYYWRVKAMNFDNESNWSDTNHFITEKKKSLNSPLLISPEKNKSEVPVSGNFKWDSVAGAEKYKLELSLYPDFLANIINAEEIDSTQLDYDSLEYYTNYYWHVAAVNSNGISPWSETWNFTTLIYENVIIRDESDKIMIINNLSDGITLLIDSEEESNRLIFNLFDLRGNRVYSYNQNKSNKGSSIIRINPGIIEKGIYFYRIITADRLHYGKFLFE